MMLLHKHQRRLRQAQHNGVDGGVEERAAGRSGGLPRVVFATAWACWEGCLGALGRTQSRGGRG
jgi:hypothetical protein